MEGPSEEKRIVVSGIVPKYEAQVQKEFNRVSDDMEKRGKKLSMKAAASNFNRAENGTTCDTRSDMPDTKRIQQVAVACSVTNCAVKGADIGAKMGKGVGKYCGAAAGVPVAAAVGVAVGTATGAAVGYAAGKSSAKTIWESGHAHGYK